MIRSSLLTVSLQCLWLSAFASSHAAAAQSCESLTSLALPNNSTIVAATSVPAGSFVPPDSTTPQMVHAFCRVQGVARPTSDSEIKFEVWMPSASWNGKLDHAGNGGYGRGFNVPGFFMVPALNRGYAVTATDMGHPRTFGYDASWAYGHPEKLIDWGYRATHVTAINAKAVIAAFYGNGPRLSYFTGCSDGGREGLMEAQRYPDDFNGIIVGASANNWTRQSPAHIWQALALIDSALPPSKLPIIANAAVAACDASDGVTDGLIDDPRQCAFDPATLQCSGADTATCLTAAQVDAVKKIYQGPRNPRTGELLYPGEERGSEALWTFTLTPTVGGLGGEFYRYLVYNDPTWDIRELDFDADVTYGDLKAGPIVSSTNPDLSAFQARSGKMIMYHGWNDQAINPRNSIDYFESVVATERPTTRGRGVGLERAALARTQNFFRLFMIPGMSHCGGGRGVTAFDALTALEAWVEQGVAPDYIIGFNSTLDLGAAVMTPATGGFTRPLCPYPQVARWTGHGSTSDAANFVCVTPKN